MKLINKAVLLLNKNFVFKARKKLETESGREEDGMKFKEEGKKNADDDEWGRKWRMEIEGGRKWMVSQNLKFWG